MILVTSYYITKSPERQEELKECLIRNNDNKYIEKIYLLNNDIHELDFIRNKNKINQIIVDSNKSNFKDSIDFINKYLENETIILANSDIYFNDTLEKINNIDLSKKVLCLLRYNKLENDEIDIFRHFGEPRTDSQDSWIFNSPLNVDLDKIDFNFGIPGCDNIFASELYNSNYELSNPSYDIISIHLHNSNEREDNEYERIHGNYCLIYPDNLNNPSKIRFMEY